MVEHGLPVEQIECRLLISADAGVVRVELEVRADRCVVQLGPAAAERELLAPVAAVEEVVVERIHDQSEQAPGDQPGERVRTAQRPHVHQRRALVLAGTNATRVGVDGPLDVRELSAQAPVGRDEELLADVVVSREEDLEQRV